MTSIRKIIKTYRKRGILSDEELRGKNIVPVQNNVFDHADSVVVLAAGPSFNLYVPKVQEYINKHKSLVIGCNYNYPIKSDYTMIIGKSIYRIKAKKSAAKKIVITPWVLHNNPEFVAKYISRGYQHYVLKTTCRHTSSQYWDGDIVLNDDGSFNHWLGNCGFSALLLSHFFTPKEVMIVGFDGPESGGIVMHHFNSITRRQKGSHADENISKGKGIFLGKIINFLNKSDTRVALWEKDRLWGLRDSLGKESFDNLGIKSYE